MFIVMVAYHKYRIGEFLDNLGIKLTNFMYFMDYLL
jgi:hypothetical protein